MQTIVFDLTYYALALTMILLLLAGTILGLWKSRSLGSKTTLGMGLVSLGGLIVISDSVVLIALSRNGLINGFLYQQVQFSVAYTAFTLVLYGLDKILFSQLVGGDQLRRARLFAWGTYIFSIGGASLFLFNPATYRVTIVGSQVYVAQQLVFWVPLFLVLVDGALTSAIAIFRSNNLQIRKYAGWSGLFSVLVFLGTLRESTIIPSTGDPFNDLLVAFAPFIAGSACALLGVLSTLPTRNEKKS